MRSFGFCSSSTCFIRLTFVLLFWSSQGFESLLELPKSGSAETRLKSKRVLSVIDFGATGNGISDDTEVNIRDRFFVYLF